LLLSGFLTNAQQPVEKVDSIISCFPYVSIPKFPGGAAAFDSFIDANFIISKEAEEKAKPGVIRVQYTIEVDGSASDVKTASMDSLGYGLEKEAIRVIELMPLWVYDTNGKRSKMTFVKPIRLTFN
jgi:protein TonB